MPAPQERSSKDIVELKSEVENWHFLIHHRARFSSRTVVSVISAELLRRSRSTAVVSSRSELRSDTAATAAIAVAVPHAHALKSDKI